MLKNPHNFLLVSMLALLMTSVSFSQERQIEKADKEFDKLAYIDAREIYLKVVEDGYESAEIYQKLGDTYYWNSDYDNAAKWYEQLIQKFPDETKAAYYLRAAQSYKSINKYDESDKLMVAYSAMTGDNLIVQNFEGTRNYLSDIAFSSRKYELEKTAINTETSDFGSAYYLTDKVVFASADGTTGGKIYTWTEQPFLDLFVADRDENGRLTNKRRLEGDINTEYHESSAVFTKDGNTIYFTRNNFLKRKAGKDKNKTVRLKLYKATKGEGDVWTNVEELPFNSKEYSVAHPALSVDEKRLYFSSDMPGTYGMSDIFYVDLEEDGTYGTPTNMGDDINTEARESFPYISNAGNLYFSSDGRAGLGGYDIYATTIDENSVVGGIENIGAPANSNQDDFALIINEDEQLGYLTSNRDGEKGSVNDDIYRIQITKCEVELAGVVVDANTKAIIPGATVILLDENNNRLSETVSDQNAEFAFPDVECSTQYTVRASKTGYTPSEEIVTMPEESAVLELELQLTPIDPCPANDLGCRLSLQPIYFDFDKSFIRPDAAIELAKILAAMRQYPELIIHIESHTDSRAPNRYNELLSERRAQSTLQWLIQNGISRNRLTAKGYGEYQLTNQCSDGVECTEEEHQLNRRSMFIIQNNNGMIDNSANERN